MKVEIGLAIPSGGNRWQEVPAARETGRARSCGDWRPRGRSFDLMPGVMESPRRDSCRQRGDPSSTSNRSQAVVWETSGETARPGLCVGRRLSTPGQRHHSFPLAGPLQEPEPPRPCHHCPSTDFRLRGGIWVNSESSPPPSLPTPQMQGGPICAARCAGGTFSFL